MDSNTPAGAVQEPVAEHLDLTAYVPVVIIKTASIEGHEYKRGERHNVDAGMYDALVAAGMILLPAA